MFWLPCECCIQVAVAGRVRGSRAQPNRQQSDQPLNSFFMKIALIKRDAPDIRPDNPALYISGIRLSTGFDLLDIRSN
jgi:hypothetical protein